MCRGARKSGRFRPGQLTRGAVGYDLTSRDFVHLLTVMADPASGAPAADALPLSASIGGISSALCRAAAAPPVETREA